MEVRLAPEQRVALRVVFSGQYKTGGRGELCPVRRVPLYNCWGLVMAVTAILGTPAPEVTAPAMPTARAIHSLHERMVPHFIRLDAPRMGCLIALRTHPRLTRAVNHFGVVLDGCRFVHIQKDTGVHVSRFDEQPYRRMIADFWLPREVTHD